MSRHLLKPESILITGASNGLGRALALRYAAPRITLFLNGRDAARLESVAYACRKKGAVAEIFACDVTRREEIERWIKSVDEARPLDLVIANAGISGGTGGVMNGEPVSQARAIFDVNLGGVLNTLGPVLPCMIERERGQVAIISSMAGFRGFPTAPAYSASKGAVRFYGEALRGALRQSGVHVSVVCPGFVRTAMTDANNFPMPFLMGADKAAAIIVKKLERDIGRIAFPWPVHLVSWLLSCLPDSAAQIFLKSLPAKQELPR